ncbi:pentatricopeptide repeat (PPR) superfamily protein [Artemisia annua]|uniref:Pentatricopeptide repeat (PPR) superfamily protein n=1 Tax=Artemisia annua TaxID=35608 RepID=A0A2U1LCL6_ARTAN|nr:pentatricopeptide repeat (PPR) superfamily protein [Artemisia annua]
MTKITFLTVALILAAFQTATAGDPDILSDFILPPGTTTVDASFFTYTGMRVLVGAPEAKTLNILKASMTEFPALNGQSVSYAVLDFPPGSVNPPHTHPRASELLLLVGGSLQVGFIDTTNKLFNQTLQTGDMFVFPKGLVHFQYNCNPKDNALAVSAFGSANAGTVSVPNSVFDTSIDDVVLAKKLSSISVTISIPEHGPISAPDENLRVPHLPILHKTLQKCAKERSPKQGMACHANIVHHGLSTNTLTSNMLINMYSKCGFLDYARKVFDEMPERTLVSWNTMIGSYTQNGNEREALNLFVMMQRDGTEFSEFTLSGILCACAAEFAVFECRQLHAFAVKASMLANMFVGTALLDVYAKCGLVEDAIRVFKYMPERSDVTWSSMVAGYVKNELYEEALVMFKKVQVNGVEFNQFIVSSVLAACAAMAAKIEGIQAHAVLFKTGFNINFFVCSSLVDMYSKCGSIREAYLVFSCAQERNVVLLNAMISGFSRHGRSMEAMILFEKMQQIGLQPNEVTYVSVLSACGHMGLVKEGKKYFDMMVKEHNLSPNVFHYSCMVDILGRTGLIDEAKNLIDKMPFEATASIWGSLLSSCRVYGNVELAEIAAKHLFEIEPENAGNHSWIEIKDKVHSFMVGERNHSKIGEIYLKLEDMMEEMRKFGYKCETRHDLHNVEENKKEELLRHHSEKLALVYGLMCLPSSAPIRIMKNLRICGDCHVFMKLASKITGREIVQPTMIAKPENIGDFYCSVSPIALRVQVWESTDVTNWWDLGTRIKMEKEQLEKKKLMEAKEKAEKEKAEKVISLFLRQLLGCNCLKCPVKVGYIQVQEANCSVTFNVGFMEDSERLS